MTAKSSAPSQKSAQSKPSLKSVAEMPIKNSWKLEQRSRVLGDQTLYVCPIGVKAVNRKDGLTILCVEPFTEVVTYSTKTRKVCRQTFERSENPYARAVAMFSGVAHSQVKVIKKREYQKGGLTWIDFKIPDDYKKERIALFRKGEVSSSEPAYGNFTGFLLPMDKRLVDWLARLYCIPRIGAVPFDVTFWDVDNDVHSLVKTFSMVSTRLTASDFKCPAGLNPVKDPRTVIQDESSTDAIEMMMGGSKSR
ncbi:MAG: hypothetical protein K2Y39_21825 [Candidatus Obscuribacterales bacterium]|nr:hypothetical protein [Candidatus Obscuribacterales bacterium]